MTDHTSGAGADGAEALETLRRLRGSIDNIDAALVYLLAERFRATKQVGKLKAEHGMPASDPAREERLSACAPSPSTPSSIPNSRRSGSLSWWPRSSATTSRRPKTAEAPSPSGALVMANHLTIGTLLESESGAPAQLLASMNRHTFWCGQSGSGKTCASASPSSRSCCTRSCRS